MRRPYDLPAFLEQENRLSAIVELHKKIVARKVILDGQMTVLNSIADVESWLHSSHPDCISSDMQLEEFDFYTSVATDGSWRKGVTWVEYKNFWKFSNIFICFCVHFQFFFPFLHLWLCSQAARRITYSKVYLLTVRRKYRTARRLFLWTSASTRLNI